MIAFTALFLVLAILLDSLWRMAAGPVHEASFRNVIVMSAAAVVAGAILIRGIDGRSPAALGLGVSRATAGHCGAGLLIGVGALAVAAAAMLGTGTLAYGTQGGTAAAWFMVVLVQAAFFTIAAFAEEVLFRGYAFQVLVRAAGPVVAAVLTSALFAAAHARNPSIGTFALINIFLAGLMLAAAYLRTLSLWFATAVHVGWNWTMATLLDLPVSGISEFDTPLYDAAVGAPDWWSGGTFGPEGGLVGTLGFAVALIAVLRWRAVRPDPAIAAAQPLILREEETHAG